MTGPAAVTTDLRATPPVEIDLPDPSARLDHASTDTNRWFDGVRYGYGTSMVGQAPPEGALKTLLKHEYEADLLFDDAQGNCGSSQRKSARTALHRDGVLVGETEDAGYGRFDVAPGEAEFRVEASYERDPVLGFGSALSASWTFRSGTTTTPTALPLGVVRFAPWLDRAGDAPPRSVRRPAGRDRPFATTTVDASFDDGATWTAVPVVDGVATVPNPASGWVSLRVAAEAADGATFGQTAIRAYRIG